MKITIQALSAIVAMSSAAAREVAANHKLARDSKTANARLCGSLPAEDLPLLESDSFGAGEEEGRFESGMPEFLTSCNNMTQFQWGLLQRGLYQRCWFQSPLWRMRLYIR